MCVNIRNSEILAHSCASLNIEHHTHKLGSHGKAIAIWDGFLAQMDAGEQKKYACVCVCVCVCVCEYGLMMPNKSQMFMYACTHVCVCREKRRYVSLLWNKVLSQHKLGDYGAGDKTCKRILRIDKRYR
jgi:hypothetical protein